MLTLTPEQNFLLNQLEEEAATVPHRAAAIPRFVNALKSGTPVSRSDIDLMLGNGIPPRDGQVRGVQLDRKRTDLSMTVKMMLESRGMLV